jgi:hypothetical protein
LCVGRSSRNQDAHNEATDPQDSMIN